MNRGDRIEIGKERLQNILAAHGIATWRTLEQKISDAGPGHLRIDPHILTVARRQLEDENIVVRHLPQPDQTPWFGLHDAPAETIASRLKAQLPTFNAVHADNFKKRLGQTMEIAVYRSLQSQTALSDTLGSYLD